jgi:hypothetical protein
VVETRGYNSDNTLSTISFGGSGTAIGNLTYTWDSNKNKTSETIGGVMSPYSFTQAGTTYDAEDRLTGFARAATSGTPQLSQSWNLSAVGDWNSVTTNGTAQSRTHGPTHELVTAGGQSVTHDTKGNMLLIPASVRANSSPLVLTWDFHTWGQRLNYHFHAHVVMTAGGLSADGTQWVKFDQDQVAADNVALAERFKKIYMRRLKKMLRERLFSEVTQTEVLEDFSYQSKGPLRYPLQQPDQASIEATLSILEAKKWVADIGVTPERFRERGERRNAMRYVGAYVAGSAIGDGRLVSAQGDTVKFRAFDYRTDQYIELEMTKVDFVEAYARHILPARLRRFRFAGLFRPTGRTARLSHCRQLLGSRETERSVPLTSRHDHTPTVHVMPTVAPEEIPDETTSKLKHGLFCSKCSQQMTRVIEIDGSMSCWMLKVALLVVAYLNTQRLASFSLAVDRESIQAALLQVLARLQAEVTITEAEASREWMCYAHVTPGELFFHEAYYEVMLLFIAQQIAEQNAAEERLAEAMLSPTHHAARGPPKRNDSKKKDGVHPR